MKNLLLTFAVALGTTLMPSFTRAQSSEAPPAAPQTEASAEESEEELLKKLGAQKTGVGKIGPQAEIDIPEGFIYFPAKGAQTLLKDWGNLTDGSELGLLLNEEKGWSVLFEFENVGYVKDDEKDSLDAAKMMKQMHDAEPTLNEARKEAGLPGQHTIGFVMEPKYNETTNNLEWAINFRVEGDPAEYVNYNTKLLGRKGVMTATLMVDPTEMDAVLPDYQKTLTGYRFASGQTYAEYREGDKLATYGLAGLIVGGAGFAAAKAGLLGKLGALIAKGGKAIIIGIVAVGALIWKVVGKLFGRRDPSTMQE